MRRAILLAATAFALLPTALAHAESRRATVVVSPAVFSPATPVVHIQASVQHAAPLGLQVVALSGRTVGWLHPESAGSALNLDWHGKLDGHSLPDGTYDLRLVSSGQQLATTRFRVDSTPPKISHLSIGDGDTPFAGDGPLLTTLSPNGDGFRDAATIALTLSEPATVTLSVNTATRALTQVAALKLDLPAGPSTFDWAPPAGLEPRTYLLNLTADDRAGNRRELGRRAVASSAARGLVVRIQGVDASFGKLTYRPGDQATLTVASDALDVTLQLFRAGGESGKTTQNDVMNGVPVTEPTHLERIPRSRLEPTPIHVGIPPDASGLYFARLTAADGRVGFAPFVVAPEHLGTHRVAIVVPTNTWQAYNFYDANGDGWGDTWYAGGPAPWVALNRPFLRRGVPPFFRRYDLPFLHWLEQRDISVDYLTDDVLNETSAAALGDAYDLIVFPGHHEYVTDAELAAVTGYRDLGGNLMFLSANNFFWRVARDGNTIRRTAQWRALGKPEASLIGTQYTANDEGHKQAPFVVRSATTAPWLWEGTGLTDGSLLGAEIGGYGTEIDGVAASSPPGTIVLAEVPDLFGPGKTAQMTYYETPAGAKVFAAGTLDFGGSVLEPTQSRMLSNLWWRLGQP